MDINKHKFFMMQVLKHIYSDMVVNTKHRDTENLKYPR